MSESEKDITGVRHRVGGGLDRDYDNGDGNGGGVDGGCCGGSRGSSEKKNQRSGCCFCGDSTKAKSTVFVSYTKAKKFLHRRKRKPSSSSSSSSSDCTGKRVIGSCFCFEQPSTLESPAESVTSDPNDPNFTFEKLRTLIETNDFYSRECNPHIYATTRPSFSSDNS